MWGAAIAFAAAIGSASAAAQPPALPPAGTQDEIVVTGSRDRRDPVASFVETATVETGGQIARFAEPICPASLGLPAAHGRTVEARIRAVADYLGLSPGGEGCRPNIVVIVAERGEDFVSRLSRERADLFGMLRPAEVRAVLRLDGPVRAWQAIELRGADGRPMQSAEVGKERRTVAMITGVMPSLTSLSTRQDLSLSFIVFDLEALEGLTLLQIADHAAMRAFARTDGAGLPQRRSILTIFADREAGAEPVPELTNWDAAYLRALYRTSNEVTAHQQRSSMLRAMRRELASAPAGEAF